MTPDLSTIWWAGVNAVRGERAVDTALRQHRTPAPTLILAVGKAACDMARPARAAFPQARMLVVTKHGHAEDPPADAQVIEAGHPIPDAASLHAGAALMDQVTSAASHDTLLLLVSGGASAVAELLPEGMTLEAWQSETETLIASGADIHAINRRRKEVSRIKSGKLVQAFRGAHATTLAISDVEGDALDVIGSGIGAAPPDPGCAFAAHIIASNAIARAACAAATAEAIQVNSETLYADVAGLAPRLGQTLRDGPPGLYIWGGEPTVLLPEAPGRGGRNQALALSLAQEISGRGDIDILVAGTDGSDGPTGDAGGRVTGTTWGPGAGDALRRADAGTYLAERQALFTSGPTGTNVMDLVIARKS